MRLLTTEAETFKSFAAAEKPFFSATRTKARMRLRFCKSLTREVLWNAETSVEAIGTVCPCQAPVHEIVGPRRDHGSRLEIANSTKILPGSSRTRLDPHVDPRR